MERLQHQEQKIGGACRTATRKVSQDKEYVLVQESTFYKARTAVTGSSKYKRRVMFNINILHTKQGAHKRPSTYLLFHYSLLQIKTSMESKEKKKENY
jgi:hypothetical protein